MSKKSGDEYLLLLLGIIIATSFLFLLINWIAVLIIKIIYIPIFILTLFCMIALTILIIPSFIFYVFFKTIQAFYKNNFKYKRAIIIPILTLFTGGSLGFVVFGGTNILAIIALASSSVPLVISLLIHPPLNRRRLIKQYQEQENEQNLINP